MNDRDTPVPLDDLALDVDRALAEALAAEALAFEAAYQAKRAELNAKPNLTSQIALAEFVANAPKKAIHF